VNRIELVAPVVLYDHDASERNRIGLERLISALWWYALNNHYLAAPELNKKFLWQEVTTPLATVSIFMLSIGLAFWNDGWARLCWVLLLPLTLFLNAKRAAA